MWKKTILLSFLVLFFVGCQTSSKKRSKDQKREIPTSAPTNPSQPAPAPPAAAEDQDEEESTSTEEAPSVPVVSQRPRLALILGPGGMRAFAHAGVLQEIAKAKIPVHWISGMEMGALPAALFSLKGQPFEAEWQMMKLKDNDVLKKSLIGSSNEPQKIEALSDSLKLMFGNAKAEDAKIQMTCPSYSNSKKQTFLMNRGPFSQMLSYCVPLRPLFEPSAGVGAQPFALTQLVQAAKQKGAQLVVYVDLLNENSIAESEDGYSWGLLQQELEFQRRSLSLETVSVSSLAGLKAFDKRREMLQRGQDAGRRLVQTLQTKYGY